MSVEFPLRKRWELYYDPLYGAIPLHPIIRRALDLKTMQRLRHIKQLSTVYLVYPGATHSRFQHSVGVSYLASRVWDVIQNKRVAGDGPDLSELELHPMHLIALQLAALFHDVGHGPWSHVFEMYCNRNPEFKEWEHETMTRLLITKGVGQYNDIPAFLHRLHGKFNKLPGSDFLLPENIAAIATGQPPPCDGKYLFLSQIVSSEHGDVDRLDYLRRDALYTGVETGSVDVWEVIHGYVVYKSKDNVFEAGISTTAAQAMEGLLFARDLAYRRVYYHKRHRAAQEMLILALHEIAPKIPHNKLALYTDEQLLSAFEKKGNSFTKKVAQAIRDREIYEPLPYEILVGQDLDEIAQRRWRELSAGPQTKADYEEWRKELRKISDDQNLTSEAWFIYDMAPLPLSKKAVFTRQYMYDETEQRVKSLLEVLPHLQLYYGQLKLGDSDKVIDQREEFEKYLSKILLIVPREFLLRCAEEFFGNLDKKIKELLSSVTSINRQETASIVFEETYQSKFKPLLEHFEWFINLQDPERRRQLEEKFRLSLFKLFFDAWIDRGQRT